MSWKGGGLRGLPRRVLALVIVLGVPIPGGVSLVRPHRFLGSGEEGLQKDLEWAGFGCRAWITGAKERG